MIKVLIIARYHDTTTTRKIELLAHEPDLQVSLIYPRTWHSELVQKQTVSAMRSVSATSLGMFGSPNDPHRAIYKTLSFSLSRIKPDIILAEEEPDSLSALQIAISRKLFAPRTALVFHSWQNVNRHKTWYVRAVYHYSMRESDAITCANTEAVEVLRQNGYCKPAVLQPAIGVDTRLFKPVSNKLPHPNFTIGFAGRLVPEKDVAVLIGAVRLLSQHNTVSSAPQLLILGDGPEKYNLESQVNAAGIGDQVCFISPVAPQQVAEWMQQLDVLVLPSRTTPVWKEQFGRVLTEAMACRVPVIGSDSGAIPEVIGDAGLTFAEGNAAALASQLARLADSPALRAELAEKGYQRVMQNYTQETIAQQTALFIRQLVAG